MFVSKPESAIYRLAVHCRKMREKKICWHHMLHLPSISYAPRVILPRNLKCAKNPIKDVKKTKHVTLCTPPNLCKCACCISCVSNFVAHTACCGQKNWFKEIKLLTGDKANQIY